MIYQQNLFLKSEKQAFMKVKFTFFVPLIILAFLFASCEDKDDNGTTGEQKKNKHVNDWVYSQMNIYYYWRDKMPASRGLDYTISPYDFFENLLCPYNSGTKEGDRFSWIQESYVDLLNSLSGVSSREIGFEYIPYLMRSGSEDVMFVVAYIKKGTKAEKSGLKRGDIITKVDGIPLNMNNWSGALYQNKSAYVLEGVNFSGKITVEPTGSYAENPIYLDSIYTIKDKKIGYIVYNQFTMDNGDNSYIYDKQLASIFSKFESENVSDLVLDMRYNGGGYVTCAVNLASALVPQRDTKEIFCYKDFNPIFTTAARREFTTQEYDQFVNNYFKDNIEYLKNNGSTVNMGSIPRYGDKINKLYILVGKNTASASELVINGLIPFMKNKIVLIGETTYGKNVGSFTLYEENDRDNKWGMQPIVSRSYNKLGDSEYAGGFTPGIGLKGEVIEDFAGIDQGLKPLGDKDESLLGFALAEITGGTKSKILKRKSVAGIKSIGSSFALKPGAYDMVINDKRINKIVK